MILSVKDLSFAYKSHKTLKNIHFSIKEGETTVILGPNGVGKTTLLKCLNSILSPKEGNILVKGQDINTMNIRQIAKEIAYVAQKNDPARITVFDAILMGRRPHISYRAAKTDLKIVDAVIKSLDLSHMSLTYLDQMSGGELQKVAIARPLVQQTDLLLLDEPTASLDLKNQAHILGLIRKIVKGHHIAAVLTMHDLNAALRYSDNYIFLKDQTIFAAGNIHEISPEMVEAVYGIKVDIMHHKGLPVVIPMEEEKAA
jgi:iron complex transport system ATP-binding protein